LNRQDAKTAKGCSLDFVLASFASWRFKPFSPHQLITRAVRRIRYNDGNLKSMKDLRDEPV
jgi:hypothetical protein